MQIKTKAFGAVIFAALTFAPCVEATEILTTTFNGWKATLTGSPTEWNLVYGNSTYNTASGTTLSVGAFGSVNATGPDGSGYVLSENGGYTYPALQGATDGVGSVTLTNSGTGLTGLLLGIGITGNAAPIVITLSDGETFTVNPPVNGNVLLGLSSGTSITSLTLTTSSGSAVELTDFWAGTSSSPADTPTAPAAEVTTALMIGSGLLVFGARRRVFSNFSRPQTQPN